MCEFCETDETDVEDNYTEQGDWDAEDESYISDEEDEEYDEDDSDNEDEDLESPAMLLNTVL